MLVTRQNPTTHTDLPQKWFSSLFTCGAAGQFLLLLKLARVVGVVRDGDVQESQTGAQAPALSSDRMIHSASNG